MLEKETLTEAKTGLVVLFKYQTHIYSIPRPQESLHKIEEATIKTPAIQTVSGNVGKSQFEFIGGGVKPGFPLAFTLQREMREELKEGLTAEMQKLAEGFIQSLDLGSARYQWMEKMEITQLKNGRRRSFPMVCVATIELSHEQFAVLKTIQPDLHALDIMRPELYRPFVQLMIREGLINNAGLTNI